MAGTGVTDENGVRIRPAVAADDEALADMDRRGWSTLHAVGPPPVPGEPFFGPPGRPGGRPEDHLVVETDGVLAGYVRLGPATSLPSNAHVLQIRGLLVEPWARGRGVGRALLDGAYEAARARGARRLTLRVLGHNADARRLYEKAGFAVEGVLPGEFLLDGEYVDDVFMGRPVR